MSITQVFNFFSFHLWCEYFIVFVIRYYEKKTVSIAIQLQKKCAFLYSVLFEHVKLLMALFSLFLALPRANIYCSFKS